MGTFGQCSLQLLFRQKLHRNFHDRIATVTYSSVDITLKLFEHNCCYKLNQVLLLRPIDAWNNLREKPIAGHIHVTQCNL